MRQIDWSKRLSDDDVAWLRASGMRFDPNGQPLEQAIQANLGTDFEAPEDNDPGRSVLDPTATGAQPFASLTADEQRAALDAGNPDADDEEPEDDYDEWSKDELKEEADKRELEVTGTGRNGSVLVKDLVSALREDDKTRA